MDDTPSRYDDPAAARAYAGKYDRSWLRRLSSRHEARLLVRGLALAGAPFDRVLDVPCAAGRMVPVLARHARHVTAADRSPAMVDVARERIAPLRATGRAEVVRADAAALPFPDATFDAVVCWRLLHHLVARADRVAVLGEARRASKGPVLVTFADAQTGKARRLAARGRRRRCVVATAADLADEARDAGLALTWTRRLFGPASVLAAALLLPAPPTSTARGSAPDA